jgi:ferritin
MPKELVLNALNEQINAELSAWYAYLGMSTWCSTKQLHGCAKWLRVQAQEEYTHAMKLYEFLIDRNSPVQLKQVDPPEMEFKSIVDVFHTAMKQEEENTERIDAIFQMAMDQRAYASLVELQWFITEQVEEEKTARENLAKVKMVSEDPAAILEFDRILHERRRILDNSPA